MIAENKNPFFLRKNGIVLLQHLINHTTSTKPLQSPLFKGY